MTGEKRQQFSSRLYHNGGNIIRSNDGNTRYAVMIFAPKRRQNHFIALGQRGQMLHQEFAFHQEMIESFASAVDSATLEEKRRLLRIIVKKVVWDGKNAYVYLFAEDGEADLPPIDQPMYPLGEDDEYYL